MEQRGSRISRPMAHRRPRCAWWWAAFALVAPCSRAQWAIGTVPTFRRRTDRRHRRTHGNQGQEAPEPRYVSPTRRWIKSAPIWRRDDHRPRAFRWCCTGASHIAPSLRSLRSRSEFRWIIRPPPVILLAGLRFFAPLPTILFTPLPSFIACFFFPHPLPSLSSSLFCSPFYSAAEGLAGKTHFHFIDFRVTNRIRHHLFAQREIPSRTFVDVPFHGHPPNSLVVVNARLAMSCQRHHRYSRAGRPPSRILRCWPR